MCAFIVCRVRQVKRIIRKLNKIFITRKLKQFNMKKNNFRDEKMQNIFNGFIEVVNKFRVEYN